jgi:hypothetical protein
MTHNALFAVHVVAKDTILLTGNFNVRAVH